MSALFQETELLGCGGDCAQGRRECNCARAQHDESERSAEMLASVLLGASMFAVFVCAAVASHFWPGVWFAGWTQ